MCPADFVEAVGAFTVQLTHMFIPVKSLAAAEMLTTVADNTINNTHHSNGHNLFFFFFFFDLKKLLEQTVGVRHEIMCRVFESSCKLQKRS